MTELEPEDFLMPYGICSDTTIGEQDKPLTELMQEYADELLIIQRVSNFVRQELERRVDLILSEHDGIVRETMIKNIPLDL